MAIKRPLPERAIVTGSGLLERLAVQGDMRGLNTVSQVLEQLAIERLTTLEDEQARAPPCSSRPAVSSPLNSGGTSTAATGPTELSPSLPRRGLAVAAGFRRWRIRRACG